MILVKHDSLRQAFAGTAPQDIRDGVDPTIEGAEIEFPFLVHTK